MPKKKILIISIIIIFIIGTIGVYIVKKKFQNNEYQIKNDTYFEVTLKPNNYFSNNIIEANNYYIANSIKSIDIYFNYDLKNQKNTNYTYDISATLKSYADNGTKLVWTKDFNLKKTTNITQKEINIEENYNLDYQYYINYVKSFQDYYNIKTENYLDIKLNIKINDKNSSSILLTIPLSDNIIEITMREDNPFLDNKNPTISFDKLIIFAFILIAIVFRK